MNVYFIGMPNWFTKYAKKQYYKSDLTLKT